MSDRSEQPQPADAGPVDQRVRRPGAYLRTPADWDNTADQCRQMGLSVGDTITGREHGPRGRWHEARLTLLWIGQKECMWLVQDRTNALPVWTEPQEEGNWTLDCRRWRYTPTKSAGVQH
jgi:hypothetical protein